MKSKIFLAIIIMQVNLLSYGTIQLNISDDNVTKVQTDNSDENRKKSSETSGITLNNYNDFKFRKTNGLINTYWRDGSLKARGYISKNLKRGYWTLFYQSSKLVYAKGLYRNDKMHGSWTFYNKNGQLRSRATYYLGMLNGQFILFRKNGIPLKIVYYRNGKKHGRESLFLANGNPRQIAQYRNGKMYGQINIYSKIGRRIIIGNFKNNIKHGRWQFSTNSYKWIRSGYYSNGKKVGKWYYYNEKGLLAKVINHSKS